MGYPPFQYLLHTLSGVQKADNNETLSWINNTILLFGTGHCNTLYESFLGKNVQDNQRNHADQHTDIDELLFPSLRNNHRVVGILRKIARHLC